MTIQDLPTWLQPYAIDLGHFLTNLLVCSLAASGFVLFVYFTTKWFPADERHD